MSRPFHRQVKSSSSSGSGGSQSGSRSHDSEAAPTRGHHRRQHAVRFPVEERLHPRVRVSDARFEDWKVLAQRELSSVLQTPSSWYYRPNEFKQAYRAVYEKDAIRGYVLDEADAKSNPDSKMETLCLAHLAMSLEDTAFALHTVSTSGQRAICAHLYEDHVADAAVLRVYEGQTAVDPFQFTGLKWLVQASPAPSLLGPSDALYFEYSGTTSDAAGRAVLFQFTRSFPLAPEEVREQALGCVRGVRDELALFRVEGGGVLYQSVGSYVAPTRDTPRWASTRAITDQFNSVRNLASLADARAVLSLGLFKHGLNAQQSKTSSSRGHEHRACVDCQKKFNLLRTRHSCGACALSICKHCVFPLTFFQGESVVNAELAPTLRGEFCAGCISHARERRRAEELTASKSKADISLTGSPHTVAMAVASAVAGAARPPPPPPAAAAVGRAPGAARISLTDGSRTQGHTDMDQSEVVFTQMTEALRQQEQLLHSLQHEHAKIHQPQHLSGSLRTPPSPLSSAGDEPQRFELLP